MRIDKYLGNLGVIDRSDVAMWVKKGYILVDGNAPRKASEHVRMGQIITIIHDTGEQIIKVCDEVTIVLHKPIGYVSSTVEDGGHASYRDLLIDFPYATICNVAGRLDVDTTGLLLCTSVNDLLHRIIHPNRKVGKTYIVNSMLELTDDELEQLRQGVMIEEKGSQVLTKPALVTRIGTHQIILTIFEGRYHQIKKMLMSINNKVVGLHRYAIGGLVLDIDEGTYKILDQQSIDQIFVVDYDAVHQGVLQYLQK